jgi:hypothetical protein
MRYPAESHKWHKDSNYLCQLSVENELELEILANKAEKEGLKVIRFYEPDIGNQLTAICLEPSEKVKYLTSSLPLMLKTKQTVVVS